MMRFLLAAVLALGTALSAHAQNAGQLGPGQVWGNAGASAGQAAPTGFSPLLDRALCGTNNDFLIRLSGTWQCGATGTSGHAVPFLDGINIWSGANTYTGGSITGLPAPTNASDAATKQYVDNTASGLTVHTAAALATTAALPANTYNNGTSGVGATLTANANGALSVDGVAVSTSQRILVKNEATAANNGIYTVTATGGVGATYVLTRATDANSPGTQSTTAIGFGTYVLVLGGSTQISSSWLVNSAVITIGTSAINWAQFSALNGVSSIGGQNGILGLDSTLHFTGSNLGLNLSTASTWTANVTLDNTKELIFNNASHAADANIFEGVGNTLNIIAGTGGFALSSGGASSVINYAGSTLSLMSGGGSINVGATATPNMLLTAKNTWGSDGAGHPYCDVRALGAGLGNATNDVAAFNSAYSTCSGGLVFIPCGAYFFNAATIVPPGTHTMGAGIACTVIQNQSSTADVFTCTNTSSNSHTEFDHFTILGTGAVNTGTVPTAGWAINCNVSGLGGGNAELFHDLEIDGTYQGVAIGGTNSHFDHNRVENIYGPYMVYCPNGGETIEDNQLDNNSAFNATGGAGFGNFNTYNTGAPTAYSLGALAQSNGSYYVVTQAGTSAPQAGGLSLHPMFYNICDGGTGGGVNPCTGLTWQFIGQAGSTIIYSGTETWIQNNDLTSPVFRSVYLDGPSGGIGTVLDWINNNDIAGAIQCGLCFNHAAANNTVIGNKLQFNGYNSAGSPTGFPIWDLTAGGGGAGNNQNNTISNNIFFAYVPDGAIILGSDFWVINGNNIATHNSQSAQQCAIQLVVGGGSPAGTTLSGNIIQNASPGAICGGADRTTTTGNTVFGGTINLTGTNHTSTGNN